MTFMFEVYYKTPADPAKEEAISGVVARLGGSLDCRETPDESGTNAICLTYEFGELESAQAAAAKLREWGDHVEGPVGYGA